MFLRLKPGPADWDEWRNRSFVKVWEAVALSFGYEPSEVRVVRPDSFGAYPTYQEAPEFTKRVRLAREEARFGGSLNYAVHSQAEVRDYSEVALPRFAKWARSLEWPMPAEMVEIAERATDPPSPVPASVVDAPRDLKTRERETLLTMIIGMAMKGYKFDPKSDRNSATQEIANDLSELGLSLDVDTVRKWLREGAKLLNRPDKQ